MTTTAITQRHDHLGANRRMLIARSLVAAAAGAVPVPLLEEWLASAIKRRTMLKIADSHAVDIDGDGARAVADGKRQSPEWTEVAGGTIAGRLLSRTWRRMLIGVIAARRAQVASSNFVIATLFDHYCVRLHVGLGLDGVSAAELRALMDQAVKQTRGGLSRRMFRRAIGAAARATAKAPLELANAATGGAVRRLLSRGSDVEAITEVDEEVERAMAEQDSFLAKAALAVELQLTADENPYLDDVIDTFERLWRNRRARHDD